MSKEAMKLALEALEHEADIGNDNAYQRERDAIREALAEQAAQQGCMRCNTPKKCALHGCSPLTWPAEQPAQQQEPVAEITAEDMGRPFNAIRIGTHFYKEIPPVGTKLYTSPPASKPWVGLTEEERDYIWHTVGNSDAHGDVDGWSGRDVMDAIEAKLREKNT